MFKAIAIVVVALPVALLITEMGKYNEELVKAGVLLAKRRRSACARRSPRRVQTVRSNSGVVGLRSAASRHREDRA